MASSGGEPSFLQSMLGSAIGIATALSVASIYNQANVDTQTYGDEQELSSLVNSDNSNSNSTTTSSSTTTTTTTATTSIDSTDTVVPTNSFHMGWGNSIAVGVATATMAIGVTSVFRSWQIKKTLNFRNRVCFMCGFQHKTAITICIVCKHRKVSNAQNNTAVISSDETKKAIENPEESELEPASVTQWQVRREDLNLPLAFVERSPMQQEASQISIHRFPYSYCTGKYPPINYALPSYADTNNITALERHQVLSSIKDTTHKIAWFRHICGKRMDYLLADRTLFNKRRWTIHVERSSMLESSYQQIFQKTRTRNGDPQPIELWRPFRVEMTENGVRTGGQDLGGVSREWFNTLGALLFSCNYGLFKSTDNGCLFVHAGSEVCNASHLEYFNFAGKLIGMALAHNFTMPVQLCDYIWKLMVDEPITISDVANLDNGLYRYLMEIKQVKNMGDCDLEFKYTFECLGEQIEISLNDDEESLIVTNNNRGLFIEKWTKMALIGRCETQLLALLDGVFAVLPQDLLSVFSFTQLKEMVNGSVTLEVKDWQNNTQYIGCSKNSNIIQWFWQIINEMNNNERSQILKFCTGTSAPPAGGFAMLRSRSGSTTKFKIKLNTSASLDSFPIAHTCFHKIDLPNYKSKADLRKALNVCKEYNKQFGFE
jgi:hypothetical protein